MHKKISHGTVHKVPKDLSKVLSSNERVLFTWEDITPLARNEFICWIENAKKEATRKQRIKRAKEVLTKGKRRPCCWPGCTHR